MRKLLYLMMFIPSLAFANDIYISQAGDSLDLDITQDGSGNVIGTSTQDVVLGSTSVASDDMTFSITQTGDNNVIAAQIYGTYYTGTWSFTGSNNTVDLLCDSTVKSSQCETVTIDITNTGSDNDYKIYVGETNDASNLVADFTVSSDNNVFDVDIDGTDGDVTLTVGDNSSLITTAVSSANDASLTASSGGSIFDIDIDGDGTTGHTLDLTVAGVSSVYTITQSGINDNTIVASFTGDEQVVDITQSD